jgi:hypothetical protein
MNTVFRVLQELGCDSKKPAGSDCSRLGRSLDSATVRAGRLSLHNLVRQLVDRVAGTREMGRQ